MICKKQKYHSKKSQRRKSITATFSKSELAQQAIAVAMADTGVALSLRLPTTQVPLWDATTIHRDPFGDVRSIRIDLAGDSELETIIEALRFAADNLERIANK